MAELSVLLGVAVALLLWFEHRTVQDIAIAYCRRACEKAEVQFLDDIAPVWHIRVIRDATGTLRLRRIFVFEYVTATGERRQGTVIMLGRAPVALQLADGPPHGSNHFIP